MQNFSEIETATYNYKKMLNDVSITRYNAKEEVIFIPAEFEQLPIYYIDKNAFLDTDIKELEIGANIVSIGQCAFKNTKLEYLEIPGNVKTIERGAFMDCSKLKVVKMIEGVEYIDSEVFANCEKLKEICLPESIEYIGDSVFENIEKKINVITENEYVIKKLKDLKQNINIKNEK